MILTLEKLLNPLNSSNIYFVMHLIWKNSQNGIKELTSYSGHFRWDGKHFVLKIIYDILELNRFQIH